MWLIHFLILDNKRGMNKTYLLVPGEKSVSARLSFSSMIATTLNF